MPNKENIKTWVDALRSGEYEQATGRLTNAARTAFCCLGVACELAVKADIIPSPRQHRTLAWYYGNEPYTSNAYLPLEVAFWLGLSESPLVEVNGTVANLTRLNDIGMSFGSIAAAIEDTYLKEHR